MRLACLPASRRWSLLAQTCVVSLTLFIALIGVYNNSNVVARASKAHEIWRRWTEPYYFRGRTHAVDPSPRCCRGADCLARNQRRHAVVTSLRTDAYLPLLEELACSLNVSSPGLPLLVLTVAGDLGVATEARAAQLGTLVRVEDVRFPNAMRDGRYALNWVKLRAWGLTDWDALLMLDADTSAVGDVRGLFALPTDFAVVLDEDKRARRYSTLGQNQGGVVFLRPCAAVAAHMLALAAGDPLLQFRNGHAEQDFFDWYFRSTRMVLPVSTNAIAHLLLDGNLTRGGDVPLIVHYTHHKPFDPDRDLPGYQYLCRRARLV